MAVIEKVLLSSSEVPWSSLLFTRGVNEPASAAVTALPNIIPVTRNRESSIIFGVSYAVMALNFIGCSFVFYQTFRRWRRSGGKGLAMTQRLPFYTAITDLLIVLLVALNISHTALTSVTWQGNTCALLAWLTNLAFNANQFLFNIIAITTYLKVCQHISTFSFGKYDWRLFALILVLVVFSNIPGLFGQYSEGLYWCQIKSDKAPYAVWNLVETLLVMTVATICYVRILIILHESCKDVPKNHFAPTETDLEARVTQKILSYLFVFLFQWIFTVVYLITFIIQTKEFWPLVFAMIGLNFGGIGNAIAYAFIERVFDQPDGKIRDPESAFHSREYTDSAMQGGTVVADSEETEISL